jgi:DNA-directed RNA polymerase specialized sigma54-like protein
VPTLELNALVHEELQQNPLLEEVSMMSRRLLDPGDRAGLQGLVAYAVNKWTHLARSVQDGPKQGRA